MSAYLTPRELAELVRTSPRTVEGWRHRGTGPAFIRAAGRVLYDRADVDAWLAENRRTSTA